MEFNSQQFRAFRKDFMDAVKQLEQQYQVKIDLGNIRYDDQLFTSKMTVNKKRADGKSPKQIEFERNCTYYGLTKSDYGATIRLGDGTEATIIGIAPRSRKYPIIVKTVRGNKEYKVRASVVKSQLAAKQPTTQAPVAKMGGLSLQLPPNFQGGRKAQVKYFLDNGEKSASEIASKLGTNAGYVSRLINELYA